MKKAYSILSILVTILVPFLLMMGAIRILINPFFLDYEYHQVNFPVDPFGFSTSDRLYWGKISLNYLVNDQGIEYLGDLKFQDGSSFYNERELSHMLDVKKLIQISLKVWIVAILVFISLWLWSWRKKWAQIFWLGVARGGFLTIGIIVAVLVGVAINFDALFRGFHALFFTGSTWLFYTSDSLIRLFPEKLWSDAFLFMGIFTLTSAIVLAFLGLRLSRTKISA
ncbi:MAG: TIGR01906 family membrane protein [Anaerolineaceae bacterium]